MDAPGIIPSEQRRYNKELVSKAWRGYQESDVCLLVIDVVKRPTQEIFDLVRRIAPREGIGEKEMRTRRAAASGWVDDGDGSSASAEPPALWFPRSIPSSGIGAQADRPPVILVLNKIDKCEEFGWVQSRELEFRAHGHFEKVFYISAKWGQGMFKLTEYLKGQAMPGEWTYPRDLRTTLPYVEQVKHQINTFLFKWFNSDLPYKIEHQTLGWTPRLDGSLLVEHELVVKDSIVARMVLGVRNKIMARMRDQVSYKLKKLWGMPVEVQIWVRPLQQRLSRKDQGRAPAQGSQARTTTTLRKPRQGKAAGKRR